MRLVHVTFRFEYTDAIERILDRHDVTDWVRYAMIEGRDRDGKHDGSQVYPGNMVALQALVPSARVDAVVEGLRDFRDAKRAHEHVRVVVLPAERVL